MISLYVIVLCAVGAIVWLAFVYGRMRCGKSDLGKVDIQVSGALSAKHNGKANFDILTLSSAKLWVISMRDEWPKNFSFQLSLSLILCDNLTQPGRGSYAIGAGSRGGAPVFSALYSHIVNDTIVQICEYGTLHEGSGVLIIKTSNDREVSGSFSFTAHRYDNSSTSLGIIEVAGEFTAGKSV